MKTVTLDDEAYRLLRAARVAPKESFSSVVKRALGRRQSWDDSAAGWKEVTDNQVKALRRSTDAVFGWTKRK